MLYFVEPCLFSLLAVFHLVPQVDWFLALKKFVDATINKPSIKIFERIFDISGSMQFVPYPRFLHVALVLFHYFWRVKRVSRISQSIKNCISCLNS